VGCEEAVIAVAVKPRRRDQVRAALEQLEGSERERGASVDVALGEEIEETGCTVTVIA
jgi:hypothetical protein